VSCVVCRVSCVVRCILGIAISRCNHHPPIGHGKVEGRGHVTLCVDTTGRRSVFAFFSCESESESESERERESESERERERGREFKVLRKIQTREGIGAPQVWCCVGWWWGLVGDILASCQRIRPTKCDIILSMAPCMSPHATHATHAHAHATRTRTRMQHTTTCGNMNLVTATKARARGGEWLRALRAWPSCTALGSPR